MNCRHLLSGISFGHAKPSRAGGHRTNRGDISLPGAILPYSKTALDADALNPEVIDPRIADVEALARWLDYAFELPGGFRFGAAGIIGLIPGIGDIIDALISLYIVLRAIQLQVPRVAVARMLVNIGIESAAGVVPIIGDLFDVAFKANRRNYRLLKSYLAQPQRQKKRDEIFMIVAVAALFLAVALPFFALVELIKHL
jgi:hypothetical protein